MLEEVLRERCWLPSYSDFIVHIECVTNLDENEMKIENPRSVYLLRGFFVCPSWITGRFTLFYDPHIGIDIVGFCSKLTFQRSAVICCIGGSFRTWILPAFSNTSAICSSGTS